MGSYGAGEDSIEIELNDGTMFNGLDLWVRDKGMQVLQFWSDAHRETSVDVFVTEPFAFDEDYARALVAPLHDKLSIRFVSLATLIRMKEEANRPQDLADIEQLRARKDSDANG
jgi:hypothetical protein